ncbi:MAG: D-aminoacyl-tRNA deacylase [Candidatus ainarchaeum sp.]|nr:D-aminoacyl-tRNA deacylase [Candidatus ainarchaeum sp.]
MKIAIVSSLVDDASVNIACCLKEVGIPKWAKYYEFNNNSINLPLEKVEEKDIIVLSKHQSITGKPSLTTHSIGNFSKADFGGIEKKLCGSLAKINTNFLRELNNKNELLEEKFLVCYEVTHHGPFSEKNVSFIELGSSKKEWVVKENAKIIAETVVDSTLKENNDKIVIGIGGGHYAPDFSKLALRKNYSFGHICPQYQLDYLDEDLLEQMISKTKAEQIILDWKGLKQNKEKIVSLCKKSGLEFERVQRLLKK